MAESIRSTPIWARPEPAARQPRFSRRQIADAALAIADAEGFEAVTMRRIARALGSGTMSLYRYIETRDDLLALVGDAVLSEAAVPGVLPADWRQAVAAVARQTRTAFLCHPWAVHFIQSKPATRAAMAGPNGLRHAEQSLSALASAPMDVGTKLDVLAIVDDYVFGHLLRAATSGAATADEAATAAFTEAQLASGQFPEIASIADRPDAATAADPSKLEARFELGLTLLLDGIEAGLR